LAAALMSCTILNIQSPDGHDEDVVVGGGGGWCFGLRSLPKSATVIALIFATAGDGVVTCGTGVDVDAVLTAAASTWLPSLAAIAAAVGVLVSSRPNIPAKLYNYIVLMAAYKMSTNKTF